MRELALMLGATPACCLALVLLLTVPGGSVVETGFYDILEVSPEVSDQEIKKAYRKLAMQYHPDKNKEPGAEDKFKAIANAYEVLSSAEKRPEYDAHGAAGPQKQRSGGGGGGGFNFHGGGFRSAQDIFAEFFGDQDPIAGFAGGGGGGGQPRLATSTSFTMSFSNGRMSSHSQSKTFRDEHGHTVTQRVTSHTDAEGRQVKSAEVVQGGAGSRILMNAPPSPPPVLHDPLGECIAFRRTGNCDAGGVREAWNDLSCVDTITPGGVR